MSPTDISLVHLSWDLIKAITWPMLVFRPVSSSPYWIMSFKYSMKIKHLYIEAFVEGIKCEFPVGKSSSRWHVKRVEAYL
jgi:hypothetical protein